MTTTTAEATTAEARAEYWRTECEAAEDREAGHQETILWAAGQLHGIDEGLINGEARGILERVIAHLDAQAGVER